MTALYCCAEWHVLAKLWMHTKSMLAQLDKASGQLRYTLQELRDEITQACCTFELPKEHTTCWCWMQAKDILKSSQFSSVPKPKGLNLNIYKFHSIGDYRQAVVQFSTMDSYTTQIVHGILHDANPVFRVCLRENLHTTP